MLLENTICCLKILYVLYILLLDNTIFVLDNTILLLDNTIFVLDNTIFVLDNTISYSII